MPVYCFECSCGLTAELIRSMKDSGKVARCLGCGGKMSRNLSAEVLGSTDLPYDKPILSESLAVVPKRVAEHRRRFPDIPILDDGRVVFTSHHQRRRVLRQLGFMDKSGYF